MGSPAWAEDAITLPTGEIARLHEVIDDVGEDQPIYRFRYVSDGFVPGALDADALLDDMTFLCQQGALPRMQTMGDVRPVIISLADRAAPFGVLDSTVAQAFEAFSIDGNRCIWEAF